MVNRVSFPVVIIILILCIAMFASPALAASIYYWDITGGTKQTDSRAISMSNVVTLTIDVSSNTGTVTVNGEEGYWSGLNQYTIDINLKPGTNNINIVAEHDSEDSDRSKNDTKTITIQYLNTNVPGSKHIINDISTAGANLNLFDNALRLSLPQQRIILNGDNPAARQKVTFRVSRVNVQHPANMTYMSHIYSINGSSTSYTLGGEPTITMKLNAPVTRSETNMLTIMRMEPFFPPELGIVSGTAQNLGGTVDYANNTISTKIPGNAFGSYAVVKMTGDFLDFYYQNKTPSQVGWSRPYVLTLWAKGVMSPLQVFPGGNLVPQGYFGLITPHNNKITPITRKELASMLVKGLKIPTDPRAALNPTFTDIGKLSVSEIMEIQSAARYGLISGYPVNGGLEFRPDTLVNRQQAAIILARAAEINLPDQQQAQAVLKNIFYGDYDQIDQWAHPYILVALQQRLLTIDREGYFEPNKQLSRVEFAHILFRIMQGKNFF